LMNIKRVLILFILVKKGRKMLHSKINLFLLVFKTFPFFYLIKY